MHNAQQIAESQGYDLTAILGRAWQEKPLFLMCIDAQTVPKIWGLTDSQCEVIAYLRSTGHLQVVVSAAIEMLRTSNVKTRVSAY